MRQEAYKSLVLAVVIAVVVVGVVWKLASRQSSQAATSAPSRADTAQAAPDRALPALIELGGRMCIPCKEMRPILHEVEQEYAGRLRVQIIYVEEDADAATKYRIELIPTQVFLDAQGNEVFRHVGKFSKEEIVAQLREMGVE